MLKNKTTFYITIITIFSSYFVGFFFREISNGAGHTDLQYHIWLLVNDFKNDFYRTLINYSSYKEATFPFFHIIQAFLNPLKSKAIYYSFFNTVLNLIILVIFFIFLKKRNIFKNENDKSLILIATLLLLSPWFRSSSFWGMTENFSLFFLIPTLIFFSKLCENKITTKTNIILTCFICLTIYSRQQYVFFPLAHLIILAIDKSKKNLINAILIYIIFSIPGIYTYNLWGVFENISRATSASDYISIKNIYINLPKISSIMFFYLIPIIFLNYKKFYSIFIKRKFIIIFIVTLIFELIIFKKINYDRYGGGYIVKFNIIFFKDNIYLILIISSLFFSILVYFYKLFNYRYYVTLFLIFLIIGLPKYLFQEWFDPIYIFVYYLFLPTSIIKNNKLNEIKSIYFLIIWESLILLIAIVYYHYFLKIPFFYNF